MARTKGSTSNVLVTLEQLTALFKPDARIPVARRFADAHNLIGKPISMSQENLKASGNAPAVEEIHIPIQEIVEIEEPEDTEEGS